MNTTLKILHVCPGRAVYVQPDGTLYLGRNAEVYHSHDDGRTWTFLAALPCALLRRCAEWSRLACRLLRHEVRCLVRLSDGTHIAANREGVFHAKAGERVMKPSRIQDHGLPVKPPMSLSAGPGDRVIWGEYWGNPSRCQVRLFVSDDGGQSFEVGHVFDPGNIKHVHHAIYDARENVYWVLVGDHGDEPGIGRLSADLKGFEWVVKGQQSYRAVRAFDLGDRLLYGTDTEMEPNAVMSLDKATGRVERICELNGSCIHACRFGGLYALSTTVEPSRVNRSRCATLWVSRDGERWTKAFEAAKDRWDAHYFQFGSLVLPHGHSEREVIAFSGQAVRGLDGQVMTAYAVEVGQ